MIETIEIRVCPKCLGHKSVRAKDAHPGQQIRTDGSCECPVCDGEGMIRETVTKSTSTSMPDNWAFTASCPNCGWSARGD